MHSYILNKENKVVLRVKIWNRPFQLSEFHHKKSNEPLSFSAFQFLSAIHLLSISIYHQ